MRVRCNDGLGRRARQTGRGSATHHPTLKRSPATFREPPRSKDNGGKRGTADCREALDGVGSFVVAGTLSKRSLPPTDREARHRPPRTPVLSEDPPIRTCWSFPSDSGLTKWSSAASVAS